MLLAGEILYRGLGRYLTYGCPVGKLKTKKTKKQNKTKKKVTSVTALQGFAKFLQIP